MEKKPTTEKAAKEWISLKTEMKRIEKRIDELKEVLEPALRDSSEGSLEFFGWRFSLVEFEKRSFSLAKAEASSKFDGRALAPFITKSSSIQIRTSWQGGEEKAA